MPESEIHILDTIRKSDLRPEDASFASRNEEYDVKKRIDTLFGKVREDEEEIV